MALVCFFALSQGDKIERIGSVAYLCAWILTIMVTPLLGDERNGNLIILLIDSALLATFASIVWKAPRNWPIWACAFQLLVVTSQVLILLKLNQHYLGYFIIVNMASFGIILALAIGTFFAWQEKVAIGKGNNELGGYS